MEIKWSEIDAETVPYRDGFVNTYLRHKGEPLLDEKGEPQKQKNGRRMVVTQQVFAEHFGIELRTFRRWLHERGKTNPERGGWGEGNTRHFDMDSVAREDNGSPPSGGISPEARQRFAEDEQQRQDEDDLRMAEAERRSLFSNVSLGVGMALESMDAGVVFPDEEIAKTIRLLETFIKKLHDYQTVNTAGTKRGQLTAVK